MWVIRPGLEFRVELASDVIWVIWKFDNLDELPLDVGARKNESGLFEISLVFVVEFVTVAMAFRDVETMIKGFREGAFFDAAWVSA